MSGTLAGRTVMVVGEGYGIVRAVALGCARRGAHVVVAYGGGGREDGEQILAKVHAEGGSGQCAGGMGRTRSGVRAAFGAVAESGRRLDGLVTCVGGGASDGASRDGANSPADWVRWCHEAAAPLMAEVAGTLVDITVAGAGSAIPLRVRTETVMAACAGAGDRGFATLLADAIALLTPAPEPAPPPAEAGPSEASQAVAVVGMGIVVPGAGSPGQFWDVLNQDQNTFGEPSHFSLEHWYSPDDKAEDKSYIRAAGYPHAVPVHPDDEGTAVRPDGTGLMLRRCLRQALDGVAREDSYRMGAYIAVPPGSLALEEATLRATADAVADTEDEARPLRELLTTRYPHSPEHPRAAFADQMIRDAGAGLLPEGSEFQAVDAACSSSLYAVDLAVKSLLAGERDLVLCGGANTGPRRDLVLFSKAQGFSRSGQVRAFDADADGVLFSDAAAVVALKRLDRALADGDEILGLLGGFGASVDGSGSVVAPDPEGQKLSVLRARSVGGSKPADIDWIVGHGTGTRVGDTAELEGLAELAGDAHHLITSNKPLVGHGAWAAGAVSLVHVLLALRHGSIPAERYFSRLPDGLRAGNLTVPIADTPWLSRAGRIRTAGICAYGLGGGNAHLVVHGPEAAYGPVPHASAGYGESQEDRHQTTADPAVLVGWSAHLPGEPSDQHIVDWLRGRGPAPAAVFGEEYPLPPFRQLRMPPVSARSIDRTHLMAISAAARFADGHGELWEPYRDTTGVFTGHTGPTRAMTEYTVRVAADDLLAAADAACGTGSGDRLRGYLDRLRARLPAANDASMPGQLANMISCQIANRHQLHGMALALDTGRSSTQAALHTACRYLASGELDIALVLGTAGHTGPLAEALTGSRAGQLAEGAVLLVLTRKSRTEQHGWPVLAELRTEAPGTAGTARDEVPEIGLSEDTPDYQGAEGALAVLRAVYSGLPTAAVRNRDPGPCVVVTPMPVPTSARDPAVPDEAFAFAAAPMERPIPVQETPNPAVRDDVPPAARNEMPPIAGEEKPGTAREEATPGAKHAEVAQAPEGMTPAGPGPGPTSLSRSVIAYRRRDAVPIEPSSPGAAADSAIRPGTLILVDSAPLALSLTLLARRHGARIVSTDPGTAHDEVVTVTGTGPQEAAIAEAIRNARRAAGRCGDLLVVASARRPERLWPAPPPPSLLRLQECVLLAVREVRPDAAGSVAALLLDPLRGHTTHPHLTLLTGFLRSLALELKCPVCAVVSDAGLESGLAQVAAERTARRDRTVVQYRQGLRYAEAVCDAPLPADRRTATPPLDRNSVVVATGGARGATAACLLALAGLARPRIWLLGTTPEGDVPGELLDTPDDRLTEARRAWLARELRTGAGLPVGSLNRRFNALLRSREIQLTLRTLRTLCGVDRVHYLVCDLRDRDQVVRAARRVHEQDGRVDLLIHGAGQIRSAAAADKTLDDFRAVRDTKVAGYHHLKEAFADPAPRLWCSFGSASGLTGYAGDTDYAAANEYLLAAARAEQQGPGGEDTTQEVTIGWGLWRDTGMVKDLAGGIARRLGTDGMSNAEGAAAFLAELAFPRPLDPAPLLGQAWSTGGATGFAPDPSLEGGLLGPPDQVTATDARWIWRPDPRRDTYLAEHLVDGRPLLPAVMMLALAAEAARQLLPGTDVTGFRDVIIEEPFYTAPKSAEAVCHITADVTGTGRVRVELRSDLVARTGRILRQGRPHCRVGVVLGERPSPPPLPAPPPQPPMEECPTARPDCSVQLSGVWRTNLRPCAGPEGSEALWLPRLESDGIFSRIAVPALLIDSTARLFRYPPQPEGDHVMGVPVAIARIDLFTGSTDTELVRDHPEGLHLWFRTEDDRAVAATRNGEVQLAVTGVEMHVTDQLPAAVHYPEWRP
ncbi:MULTISPECIES: SDR family NAD(P)-dependent oxidoreductase [unclassified Streptomyces]|uniref:SDR family NAD(P)-dependent oxidoreductase n=1 Tax=unclassified Streptomyces TaxID=2593676 RepID=UPI002E7FBD9F|nr:SDR family NAD(P)-dependent oxidoreductase [Streptomyces sp. NBC_00589]WTI42152.1 SDR family NAD(P)-dependent oxidoreductase [Streptomyces sp. NBC_00775]WUB24166.1 SDR family NAD(P)-dependent oxidoreductase [Streptomyces sp. NBC_00589]